MSRTIWAWAALLALAIPNCGASAAPTRITFDGACNTATITTAGESVNAVLGGTHCGSGYATGLNGRTVDGNFSGMAILFYNDDASYFLMLSRPYVTGGSWVLYKTTSGLRGTSTHGTYTVGGTAEHHPRGSRSITSLVH